VTRERIQENTGWPVRYANDVAETAPPTRDELEVLRELHARTAKAHGAQAA
jgi:glutaconate CoA-transferase subunit B